MRRSTSELNQIPREFHENGAPELPELPDEFNRSAPVVVYDETARRKRMRKVLMILGAAGVFAFAAFAPRAAEPPAKGEADAGEQPPAQSAEPGAPTPSDFLFSTDSPAPTAETSSGPTPETTSEPTPEPTPEPTHEPLPGVDAILIRSSLVYYGTVRFSGTDRITEASMRIGEPNGGETAMEYAFTREEIDSGEYKIEKFDANGFRSEYADALILETTFRYRTASGEETRTERFGAETIPWVNVNYDTEEDIGGILEMMYGEVYPNCFVVRIEEAEKDHPQVIFGDDPSVLEEGGILITVSAEGAMLTGTFEPVAIYADFDGDKLCFFPVYAVALPSDFPPHGTAHIVIRQKLVEHDYVFEKSAFEVSY